MNGTGKHGCCCHNESQQPAATPQLSATKKTAKILPSALLSGLIAFFPKCPMCWAAYMSMFGSLGLANLPYMGWLMPVLAVFLAVHLVMLLRRAKRIGYLPFVLSLAGAIVIFCARTYFTGEQWILLTGMALIISGSLLNSFSYFRLQLSTPKY